jgi:hypothetical protein
MKVFHDHLRFPRASALVALAITTLILSGCAGVPFTPLQPPPAGYAADKFDFLAVSVAPHEGVELLAPDKERLTQSIIKQAQASHLGHFKGFNPVESSPNTLVLEVEMTRYEKGNAAARLMLAGLGQIHVDGLVTVKNKDTGAMLGKYAVQRTYFGGGLMGATTSVEQIETQFAVGVIAGAASK